MSAGPRKKTTRIGRPPAILVAVALAALSAMARGPAQPEAVEDETAARELLRSAVEAFGGERWLGLKSQISRGKGSFTPPGSPEPIPLQSLTLLRIFPDLRRTELELPFGAVTQVFNGREGWVIAAGQRQDQTGAMMQASRFGLDLLRRMGKGRYTARLLGETEVEGRKVRGAALSDQDGNATRFWIEPETGRVLKVEYSLNGRQVEEFYSDYRRVNDLTLPHKYGRTVDGDKALEIDFIEFKINQEIDPSLFEREKP